MSFPPLMENSHEGGSAAALRSFFLYLCTWEIMYHSARYLLRSGLDRFPDWILDPSLFDGIRQNQDNNGHHHNGSKNGHHNGSKNGHHNGSKNGHHNGSNGNHAAPPQSRPPTPSPLDDAKRTLIQRGPSYVVSLLHSVYVTRRGISHLCQLWNASNLDKVLIAKEGIADSYRWAQLYVGETNTLFLSYLVYDLFHILLQYPKLGGIDTVVHHVLFAACSVINGTFGILPFAFGWLIVGEASTVFLNARWFLLKSGRHSGDLCDKNNRLFVAAFFLTRIVIYTAGVVHLFSGRNIDELRLLPEKSGVPSSLLGMTCVCLLLGWALNVLWGYKILAMFRGGGGKKEKKLQ